MHDSLEFYAMYRSRLDHVGDSKAKAPVTGGKRTNIGVQRVVGKILIASGRVLVACGMRWVGHAGTSPDRGPADARAIAGRRIETYG